MPDSPFIADFRALLAKHSIITPAFAHGSRAFDAAKPSCLYSGPVYGVDEIVAATSALVEGKWAVAGEHTHRFEQLFSRYLGQRESVAVNSGSSADLIMVAAAKARFGWKDGDGIIVSPCGFPTTISAITLNGLTPVFVDIEWSTLNADNSAIERALEWNRTGQFKNCVSGQMFSPAIRAIIISPVLGNPPDMDRLTELAERYEVKLLLDGCDSLGTLWNGRHLASYAVASSCSFFPSHHISTLQGGMVSSNDTELLRLARSMSTWGKDCWCTGAGNLLPNGCCGKRFSCWLPSLPDVVVDHRYTYTTAQAYNLQLPDLLGALGCAQMARLEAIHEARRAAYERLAEIARQSGLVTAGQLTAAQPSWFGFPIICPTYEYKQALVTHLEAAGIQTRNYFAGNLLLHPGYSHLGRAKDYPNAQEVLRKVFFIGTNPGWTAAHFAHIEATIKAFIPPHV